MIFTTDPILDILPDVDRIFPESSSHMAQPQGPQVLGCNPYGPLDFSQCQGQPHDMPKKALKWLPRFSADNVISFTDHVEALEKAFHDNEIVHEDVAMKLLVISLDGNAYRWYKGLRNNYIIEFDDFVNKLKEE